MAEAAFTFEALPAGYGDCLLLTFPTDTGFWRLLVDTGPDETYPVLRARLAQIPLGRNGRRRVDLFVVSHIDHDHIGGAAQLLDDADLKLEFGDIWFNAPPTPSTRGVAEGATLASILGATARALPWNEAWEARGKLACTPAAGGGVELRGRGAPTITLLSPGPAQLRKLWASWDTELKRLAQTRREMELPPTERPLLISNIEALAAKSTPVDDAVPNGSSIAFLVEHRGASALLCADAHPTVLVPALEALIKRRKTNGRLPVDVLKVSHHGSSANTTTALLGLVQARHVVISTNNAHFNHPNPEAMARLVLAGKGSTFWFTYDTPKNKIWDAAGLKTRYGFSTRYPKPGTGALISLSQS